MADLNEKANLAQATHLLNACYDFNLMWIEEPLPSQDISVQKTSGTVICSDYRKGNIIKG